MMNLYIALPLLFSGKSITDIPNDDVRAGLELSGAIGDAVRYIGQMIFSLLATMLNAVEDAFTWIVNLNLMSFSEMKVIDIELTKLIWTLLTLTLIIVCILKMISVNKDLSFLMNIVYISLALIAFTDLFDMAQEAKISGVNTINTIVNQNKIDHISDKIYRMNAFDMKKSVEKNELVTLSDKIYPKDLPYSTSMEGVVNDKLTYIYEDGTKTYGELDDGIFGSGFLADKYYAYYIRYFQLNITCLLTLIVFLMGCWKIAYQQCVYFAMRLFGRFIVVTSVSTWDRAKSFFIDLIKNVAGVLITYLSMMLFGIITSNMLTKMGDNWIGACFVIIVYGFVCIGGNDWILQSLQIDDGSRSIMKSMFMGHAIARVGKNAVNTVGNIASSASSAVLNSASTVSGGFGMFADRVDSKFNNAYKDFTNAETQMANGKQMRDGLYNYLNQEKAMKGVPRLENWSDKDTIYNGVNGNQNMKLHTPEDEMRTFNTMAMQQNAFDRVNQDWNDETPRLENWADANQMYQTSSGITGLSSDGDVIDLGVQNNDADIDTAISDNNMHSQGEIRGFMATDDYNDMMQYVKPYSQYKTDCNKGDYSVYAVPGVKFENGEYKFKPSGGMNWDNMTFMDKGKRYDFKEYNKYSHRAGMKTLDYPEVIYKSPTQMPASEFKSLFSEEIKKSQEFAKELELRRRKGDNK